MNAFIVDGIRTPIGNFSGSLSAVRADDLAALTIAELMRRNRGLNPEVIADVIIGCANQAGEDNRNVARMALLIAGLPVNIPGETVNRLCASGMSAAVNAARAAHAGEGDVFIAGGVEHMTRAPWVISKTTVAFGRDAQMFDSSFGWRFINPKMKELYGTDAMGETAENLAEMYKISREDQDRFALWSQQKAGAAEKNGRLAAERFAIDIPQKKGEPIQFIKDEFIRPESDATGLAKLKPAFRKEGSVTAGNASGLNDGAAALLIANEKGIITNGLKPMSRIVSSAVFGVEPRIMGIGPVGASELALQRAGLSMDDMDVIELNEAFAAQVLACTRQLNLEDDDARLNPNGGAISLGHPLGMSGARLMQTASIQLKQVKGRYALCTMCIGVGQGYAVILENIDL
jgi:acetyl-CoA acyltransferase